MTTELVDAMCKAFEWPTFKKPEEWWFKRSEAIGERRAWLDEENWTPWVRIQDFPEQVDIRAKIYPTRGRKENPLIQLRKADERKWVFSMVYNDFDNLMRIMRRWYYDENCSVDFQESVIQDRWVEKNKGLLLCSNREQRPCLCSLFKVNPNQKYGWLPTKEVHAVKFSQEFCKQLAFPGNVFGNILSFENFFIFNTNIMKIWNGEELLKTLEQHIRRTGSTEEKTEQKSTS